MIHECLPTAFGLIRNIVFIKMYFLNCIEVLSGTKWVSNKWFHMDGQELARPCDLNPIKRNDYL